MKNLVYNAFRTNWNECPVLHHGYFVDYGVPVIL